MANLLTLPVSVMVEDSEHCSPNCGLLRKCFCLGVHYSSMPTRLPPGIIALIIDKKTDLYFRCDYCRFAAK